MDIIPLTPPQPDLTYPSGVDIAGVQDQPFTVKNPKLDSNSALAKKRRAKAGMPGTIQEQLTQESMEAGDQS